MACSGPEYAVGRSSTRASSPGLSLFPCCPTARTWVSSGQMITPYHAERRDLFGAQDEVDAKKEELLAQVESRLGRRTTVTQLFTIRWRVV